MDIKQLEYFVAVAEHCSLSCASVVLGIAQSALCLVEPAVRGADGKAPARAAVPLADLPGHPLILPQRAHVIRRQLEAQATLAGLRLNIAWEVSSVAAIIDVVCAGYGSAVLTAGAVRASGRAGELSFRPLCNPALQSVLCLAVPANKRPTALTRHATGLVRSLVEALPQAEAAASLPG